MNKFIIGSTVALALSAFACASNGPNLRPVYYSNPVAQRDAITDVGESEIYSASDKPEMVACDQPGSESNLWTIPGSSDPTQTYTRSDAEFVVTKMYGTAKRLAEQICPHTLQPGNIVAHPTDSNIVAINSK